MNSHRITKKRCDLCGVNVNGERNYSMHIKGKKHRLKLRICGVRELENQIDGPELAPREPVPAGLEDTMTSTCQIQSELNSHTLTPLIGLEYLVEATVNNDKSRIEYFCLLCEKKGPRRIVLSHLTSMQHQWNYLGKLYPSVHGYIARLVADPNSKQLAAKIVNAVAEKLERKFGRMKPLVLEKQALLLNRKYICENIKKEKNKWDISQVSLSDILGGKKKDKRNGSLKKEGATQELGQIRMPDDKDGSPEDIQITETVSKAEANDGVWVPNSIRMKERLEQSESSMIDKSKVKQAYVEKFCKNDGVYSASDNRASESPSRASLLSSRSESPAFRRRQRVVLMSQRRERYDNDHYRPVRRNISPRRSMSPLMSRSRSCSTSQSRCSSVSRRRMRSHSRSPIRESSHVTAKMSQNSQENQFGISRPHSRSPCDKKRRGSCGSEISGTTHKRNKDERLVWDQFRVEADDLETEMAATLQRFERSPEKHPSYACEWKEFYGSRMKGRDIRNPISNDLKEEWILYWGKKMHELHWQEFLRKKDCIRKRLGLPEEPEPVPFVQFEKKKKSRHGASFTEPNDDWIPPAPVKLADRVSSPTIPNPPSIASTAKLDTISDLKLYWKEMTGSDIRYEQTGVKSESPKADIIPTLRLVSALEEQLGSLGPQINHHLSYALTLQRTDPSLNSLGVTSDILTLFETVKEKLVGQLETGIVRRGLVAAVQRTVSAISSLLRNISLHRIPVQSATGDSPIKSEMRELISAAILSGCVESSTKIMATESLPLAIPGVGKVDKVAIAQQIALALIAKGRTNVSERELQTLVEEIIGLAQGRRELSFKPSDSSAVRRAICGKKSLKDLMTIVRGHLGTADSPGTASISRGKKYSLIKVDLEENPCKKNYAAHSLRRCNSDLKENVKTSGANNNNTTLQRLPASDMQRNGMICNSVAEEPKGNYSRAPHTFSAHASIHGVHSNIMVPEQEAPLIRIKQECPTWESVPSQTNDEDYPRTSSVYCNNEMNSGFDRRPDGAIRVMHPTDPRRHSLDPRSLKSGHKRPIVQNETLEEDYLKLEDNFQAHTGNHGQMQILSAQSRNPLGRPFYEPQMAANMQNSSHNVPYSACEIPRDGFSRPVSSGNRSRYEVRSADYYLHQENWNYQNDEFQLRYSRQDYCN